MVRVLCLFEVTYSICAVLQGLARLARRVWHVWVSDAWTCLDVVRTWYGHLGRRAAQVCAAPRCGSPPPPRASPPHRRRHCHRHPPCHKGSCWTDHLARHSLRCPTGVRFVHSNELVAVSAPPTDDAPWLAWTRAAASTQSSQTSSGVLDFKPVRRGVYERGTGQGKCNLMQVAASWWLLPRPPSPSSLSGRPWRCAGILA
eukprot:1812767-Prymnesium_polylepis.1